jgi:hypothetical protein
MGSRVASVAPDFCTLDRLLAGEMTRALSRTGGTVQFLTEPTRERTIRRYIARAEARPAHPIQPIARAYRPRASMTRVKLLM